MTEIRTYALHDVICRVVEKSLDVLEQRVPILLDKVVNLQEEKKVTLT